MIVVHTLYSYICVNRAKDVADRAIPRCDRAIVVRKRAIHSNDRAFMLLHRAKALEDRAISGIFVVSYFVKCFAITTF